MYKHSANLNSQDALIALLGSAVGTAGGYGLYKLLTPKQNQTTAKGLGSALIGGAGGAGLGLLGSKWYSATGDAMRLEGLKRQAEVAAKVKEQAKNLDAARQESK
jgi:hypothetical protein